ncbi:MAG: hypothetical protein NXI30_18930 [bacterium]|nr:hypothetical protein [bacterium]
MATPDPDPDAEMREEARASLIRIQQFDPESLPRENVLGSSFHFRDAVAPARRLIELYERLAPSALDDLPLQQLQQIRDQANQDYQRIDEILEFDPKEANATALHQQCVNNLIGAYQPTFALLHPFISYSLHKTADFNRLEGEARATLQAIRDQADEITQALEKDKVAAEQVLQDVRKVAAERGVTQQAIYFQESADKHDERSDEWQTRTVRVAMGLGLYAFATLFFHKWEWLAPTDTYQAIQMAVSKILVFATISYMLYLCAKNMLSHKHNAIVDRHRQNALMTYKAIVEAAGETPNREVILVQAAACIFGPQGTGYAQDSAPPPPGAHSVVEFLSQPLRGGGD